MKSTKNILILILSLSILAIGSCQNWSKTAKGGAIGAGAGALAGAVIGKATGNTVKGTIIGAAVGGAAGAAIGNYMDRQAREIQQDLKNAKVERIGEGIKITFDSGILFDVNSYALRSEARENIAKLADVLKKYDDTNILYAGHTDNTGTNEYNQQLSEKRAKAVAEYSAFLDVNPERMTIIGFGEEQPVVTNETIEGRQQNRRVEIAIYANEKLKRMARNGELGS